MHLQPGLRVLSNDIQQLYRGLCLLRRVRIRVQLLREWRPSDVVYVLAWVGVDCDGIQRVCHHVLFVLDGRV